MANIKKKRSSRPTGLKFLALVFGVLLLGVAAYVVTQYYHQKKNSITSTQGQSSSSTASTAPTTSTKTSSKPTVNLNPPTDAQKNATRDTTTSSKSAVTPVITSFDAQQVRAFVDGISEDGGTCTATYTHGADIVTVSSTAFSDVSHTTCGLMKLDGPVNIAGNWSIVVTYNSSTSSGKSAPKDLKVQ